MNSSVFFRLLDEQVPAKGHSLQREIHGLVRGERTERTVVVDLAEFTVVERSPFAYWALPLVNLFPKYPKLQPLLGDVIRGPEVYDLRQSMRLWIEVTPGSVGPSAKWVNYAKGGELKPYASDIHLVVDYGATLDGTQPFRRPGDDSYYFLPGLTYTQRTTSRLTLRLLNAECLTSPKGPGIVPSEVKWTWYLLALANSSLFQQLIELKVGAADAAAKSYDLHILRDMPVPPIEGDPLQRITALAQEILMLVETDDRADELSHSFALPEFTDSISLVEANLALVAEMEARRLASDEIQATLDAHVVDLYGLEKVDVDREQLERMSSGELDLRQESSEPMNSLNDFSMRVQNLFMWCVGVVFGRWDVRFALNSELLPGLQGPFDPLPRVAPGGLVGPDGLPAARDTIASEAWLAARENVLHVPDLPLPDSAPATIPAADYPLPVAWDGILVDDPTHPSDIVARMRDVLALLWGDRAGAIEQEACDILGVNSLRDYVRDPRNGFFAFHIKRYSKSRRKAPIYWLLQSANRNYAIWLYIHRMDDQTYFTAARDYADAKVNLEAARLDELREGLSALSGSAQKRREREIEQQEKLVDEVTTFRNTLDKIALLGLPPDLNDGVVLGIAPLHELVPWKEADKYWQALLDGEYVWSTMAQRMRERGLVK